MSWRRRHGRKKYSLEQGLVFLIVGTIFAFVYGSESTKTSLLSLITPLIVISVIGFVLNVIYKRYKYNQLSKTGIFDIDKMSGTEFEDRLMVLFKDLGYNVRHIGGTGDAGVDLIIEKNGRRTAVQAKRYQGNVGEAAVQQVHTGKDYYKCHDAIIVSNSNFTKMAWKVAKATNIKLWSRNYLIKVFQTEQERQNPSTSPSSTPYWVDNAARWLWEKFPLSKDSAIQRDQQATAVPKQEQPPAQTSPELLTYISDHVSAGEQWPDIKTKLLQEGWKEEVLNNAFFQVYNSKPTESTQQSPAPSQSTNSNQIS